MNGQFEFQTTGFVDTQKARAERTEQGNNLLGGHELATWLVASLRNREFKAGEPFIEDHGYDFVIEHGGRKYICVCLVEDEPDDLAAHVRDGRVDVILQRSLMDRLTGRNREQPGDPVNAAVGDILAADQRISWPQA